MSARLLNPVLVSELKPVRSTNASDRKSNLSSKNFAALSSIKRTLFGPVDHEECRVFVERELQKHHNFNMEHWEFDFENEIPRPGKGRFQWEATYEKTNVRPVKRMRVQRDSDNAHLYHEPLEDVVDRQVATPFSRTNRKQSKITGIFFKLFKIFFTNYTMPTINLIFCILNAGF